MRTIGSIIVIFVLVVGTMYAYTRWTTPTPPVDQCVNVDDVQLTIPTGQVRTADGVCKPVTGTTVDVVATQVAATITAAVKTNPPVDPIAIAVAATIAARPAAPTGGSTSGSTAPVPTVTPATNLGNPAPPPASASGKIGTADFDAIGAVNCYRVEDGNVAGAQLRPHNDLQKPNWSERMDLDGAEGVGVIPKGMMSTVHTAKAYRSPANNVSPVCGKR